MEPKHKCYGTSNTTVSQKQYSDPRKQYSLRWDSNSKECDNVQAKGNLSAGVARKGKGKYELDDYYKKHSMYGLDEESESKESDDEKEKEKKKELQRFREVSKEIHQERIDSKNLRSQQSKVKPFEKDYKVDESHENPQSKVKRRKVTITDLGPDSDNAEIDDDFSHDKKFEDPKLRGNLQVSLLKEKCQKLQWNKVQIGDQLEVCQLIERIRKHLKLMQIKFSCKKVRLQL